MKFAGLLALFLSASSVLAAPTEWHAKCQVGGNPEKEITVTKREPAVVWESKDYSYSVELTDNSLTLRADAISDEVNKDEIVNYSYIEYKNELPGMMILTSRVANVFSCREMN